MNKCHTPIVFRDYTTPALSAANLNYEDGCIDTIDDRIITLDSNKASMSDLLTSMVDWNVNNTTGDVTLTFKSGQTVVRHTNLGKIAINVRVIHDPTDPHYQDMEITMPDGTKDYVDFSAFVTQFEFVDSSEIHATVNNNGEVSFNIINGSISGTKLQPNYLADCNIAKSGAESAAQSATVDGLKSEGYANGTQNGTPVTSESPYYHNNSKYWRDQAQAVAQQSLGGLTDVGLVNPQDGQLLAYNASLQQWTNDSIVIPDVSGKADKVANVANTGDIAILDANGNLADAGVTLTEVANTYATKPSSYTSGNLPSLNASGNLADSGIASSDIVTLSKSASAGSTEKSLVTRGEKAEWNAKTSNTGTVTSVVGGTGLSGGTITTTGTLAVLYGTTAGTACQGNDSRLSNARTPTAHNQAASTITAGTLAGQVLANATAVTTLANKQVRNITISTTDLTAGTSALTTGDIYLVYE